MKLIKQSFFLIIFLLICTNGVAQDSMHSEAEEEETTDSEKKFHAGLYVGSLFANHYTANVYDGFGFDFDGNKNDFEHSIMNLRINYEYGGGNGQPDQIAEALNVNHGEWHFTESDMPINMEYRSAFLIGVNTQYCFDKKNAFIFNFNFSKITLSGNFTIETDFFGGGPTNLSTTVHTYGINGEEQRLMFQAGYQRILGKGKTINPFIEGGLSATFAEFEKNQCVVEYILIDLGNYYAQSGVYGSPYLVEKPTGTGFGFFSGFGINLTMSSKWTAQLLYSPSYEKINIGVDPKYTWQQAVGLRAYYLL